MVVHVPVNSFPWQILPQSMEAATPDVRPRAMAERAKEKRILLVFEAEVENVK